MAARLRILSKAPKFKTALHDSIISYYWRGKVIFDTERAKKYLPQCDSILPQIQ